MSSIGDFVLSGRRQFAVILGDSEMISTISNKATFYHIDATFGVVPGHIKVLQVRSSQVLNIVADYGGATVSVFTIIMSCRKVDMYRKIFNLIKTKFPEFAPKTVMADWEVSLRKAVGNAYPETRLAGCL